MTAYLGRSFTVRQPTETPPRDSATCTHWWTPRGCYWCGTRQPEPEDTMGEAELWDALELAWGIIANAGGGDWTRETEEWQEAAARWRDAYLSGLGHYLAKRGPVTTQAV